MRRVLGLNAVVVAAAAGAQDVVVFQDTEFQNEDWASLAFVLEPTTAATSGQTTTGGNPGSYWGMTHSWTDGVFGTFAGIFVFHGRDDWTLDADVFARIETFRFEQDVIFSSTLGGAVGVSFGFRQGDSIYRFANFGVNSAGWTTVERTYMRDEFFLTSPGGAIEPDLSPGAEPFVFGFVRNNSSQLNGTITHGADNYRIELTLTAKPCNPSDLSEPFAVLDLADIDSFIAAFIDQNPTADLAAPLGIIDLDDIDAFIAAFIAGCP